MKKLIYLLISLTLLISCEDNFEQYYKGGVPSPYEFDFRIVRIEFDENYIHNNDEYRYYYEIYQQYSNFHNSITFKLPPKSTTTKVHLSSTVDWEFTNIPEWLTITPSSGKPIVTHVDYYYGYSSATDTISFTAAENSYVSTRIAKVYLVGKKDGWKRVDTLNFTQYGINPNVEGSVETITMKAKADTAYTYINCNCDFEVECSNIYWDEEESIADWFKAEIVKSDLTDYTHKIIITSSDYILASDEYHQREYNGYLKFYSKYSEDGTKEYFDYRIEVIKEAPSITIGSESEYYGSITMNPEGEELEIYISANCEFELNHDSWFSAICEPVNHQSYTHKIRVSAPKYVIPDSEDYLSELYGKIEFVYKDNNNNQISLNSLSITQESPSIDREYDEYWQGSYTFIPQSSSQSIYITANYDFTIEHEDWISYKAEPIEHEYHTHKLIVTVTDYPITNNSDWSSREGNLKFVYTDSNGNKVEVYNIDIRQNAPNAYATNNSSFYYSGIATKDTIDITANCLFTTSCSVDWIKIDNIIRNDSTYNVQLAISVDEYPTETSSYSSRSSYITLYYYNENSEIVKSLGTIYVNQEEHTITTEQSKTCDVNQQAHTISYTINAEANWEAATNVSWIHLSTTSGEKGNHTISISIDELPTDSTSRSGNIKFSLFGETKLTITVNQVKTN